MGVWTEAERKAFNPPERLTPSEWTNRYRVLPVSVAAEAGRLRLSRTPYMAAILDAVGEVGVEEIVCLKSTQIGWSTALESLIGYWVDNEPGPILAIYPSQKTAQEVMSERIRPLVEHTPAVRQHAPASAHDATLTAIEFDTCPLYMGWAGSADSLSRRAVRYAVCDEVDKYPSNAGREADPISLATERTRTYLHRRKVLIGSTPTVRTGTIWRAWEACGDKRRYHVPCPHCGQFQPLVFTQIKWPKPATDDKAKAADTIEQQQLAHYECQHCRQPIREGDKAKMIGGGVWLSESQTIDVAGRVSGERPRAKRVGFWINAIYSPWLTFSTIAAEFLRSQTNGTLQNFRNSWLAEVWEEVTQAATVDDFRKLAEGAPPALVVPAWAEYIIASADVQKDRLYWTVRAWGAGYRSQLITFGIAYSWHELRQHTLQTQFKLASGGTSLAHLLVIDAGYRDTEVYDFAKTDSRIKPVKGGNDNQAMLLKYSPAGKQWGLTLSMLNTQMAKDKLAFLRKDVGRWLLNHAVTDEYLQHLASEHKIVVKGVETWQRKTSGAANHWLDAEVYNLAGAELARVDLLVVPEETTPPAPELKPLVKPAKQSPPPPRVEQRIEPEEIPEIEMQNRKQSSSWLGNRSGWLR